MVSEADVKAQAQAALGEIDSLREVVREITLAALSRRHVDKESIRSIVRAVTEGVTSTLDAPMQDVRSSLSQALHGMDDALGKTAQAAKLAAEEAMGRSTEFTDQDLKTALDELASLEDLFLETVKTVAKQTNSVTRGVLTELTSHMQKTGTVVGAQAKAAVADLQTQLRRTGRDTAVAAAQAGRVLGSHMAQIASGILAGMADALQPKGEPRK